MLHRFRGGVRLLGDKTPLANAPLTPLSPPPGRVILPLVRGGALCAPAVQAGDKVLAGQQVGIPQGEGLPVHSPVSGTVAALEERPQTAGGAVPCVIIDSDGLDTPADPVPRPDAPRKLTPRQIGDILRDCGVADLETGEAVHTLLAKARGKADTLILNGCESDPYLSSDYRLMAERPEKVALGGKVLMKALGLSGCTLAIGADKLAAAEGLRAAGGAFLEVLPLRVRYPQDGERQLTEALTGRLTPPEGTPLDVGCVIFSVATAAAVYDAVYEGRPLTHRGVTVAGMGVRSPGNLWVPLGTPLRDLGEACGMKGTPGRTVAGGAMRGTAQRDLEAPVTEGVSGLLLLSHRESSPPERNQGPCIRCGRCAAACPMGLLPLYLHQRTEAGAGEELEGLHIMDCTECGACAYVCPAHIPLVRSIRAGKGLREEGERRGRKR